MIFVMFLSVERCDGLITVVDSSLSLLRSFVDKCCIGQFLILGYYNSLCSVVQGFSLFFFLGCDCGCFLELVCCYVTMLMEIDRF